MIISSAMAFLFTFSTWAETQDVVMKVAGQSLDLLKRPPGEVFVKNLENHHESNINMI